MFWLYLIDDNKWTSLKSDVLKLNLFWRIDSVLNETLTWKVIIHQQGTWFVRTHLAKIWFFLREIFKLSRHFGLVALLWHRKFHGIEYLSGRTRRFVHSWSFVLWKIYRLLQQYGNTRRMSSWLRFQSNQWNVRLSGECRLCRHLSRKWYVDIQIWEILHQVCSLHRWYIVICRVSSWFVLRPSSWKL